MAAIPLVSLLLGALLFWEDLLYRCGPPDQSLRVWWCTNRVTGTVAIL